MFVCSCRFYSLTAVDLGDLMAEGPGLSGNRPRCAPFWDDFLACVVRVGRNDQWVQCQNYREDYLECLHHKKLVSLLSRCIDLWKFIGSLMHLSSAIPGGEGTPGKGGDFVQDPVEVLEFPLLEGDTAIKVKKFPLPDGDHIEKHQTTVNLRVQT